MHVKAKKIAFLGMLSAIAVLLITFGTIFEASTLFFICAASFCVGIADREWGIRYGGAFLITSVFVALIIAPNKIYCFTYAVMGLYLWLSEILWEKISLSERKNKMFILWAGRYLIFNVIYISILIFFPSLIIAKKIETGMLFILIVAGQAGVFIFEKAHEYFQRFLWGKIRRNMIK